MMPIRHEQRRWPAFAKGAGDAIKPVEWQQRPAASKDRVKGAAEQAKMP
jgi:hypothetical protein